MSGADRLLLSATAQAHPPRLEDLMGAAPLALLLTNLEGRAVGINPPACRLLGVAAEEVLGPNPLDVRRRLRSINPVIASELDKAYRGETVDVPEFFLQVAPGPRRRPVPDRLARGFWTWARAFPVRDQDDVFCWVAILFDDVSEKKDLEGLLLQVQKMETIGTLAGGLAHDFNNILSGVVGYASLLAARLPRGTPDHEAATTILDAADRAATLTGHLMTIARRSMPTLASLDLAELLRHSGAVLARSLGPRHPLDLDIAPGLSRLDGDRPQIEQVVANLIQNARDAMPEGGTIRVRAGNRSFGPRERPPLPSMPGGEYVEVEVTDTGVGMAPEVASRIFEPFFTTKEMGPGTGLGLAIAYGIVKSHRGFILVRSAPGEGSSLTVFLPRGRMAPPVPTRPATRRSEKVGPLSVLVIDDEAMIRRVVGDMLARLGHRSEECDSVQGALDLLMADRARFDVLLVDVIMPEKSGLDLVEALREADIEVPAILCTGYSSSEIQASVRSLPATTILPKPFDVSGLEAALARALQRV